MSPYRRIPVSTDAARQKGCGMVRLSPHRGGRQGESGQGDPEPRRPRSLNAGRQGSFVERSTNKGRPVPPSSQRPPGPQTKRPATGPA